MRLILEERRQLAALYYERESRLKQLDDDFQETNYQEENSKKLKMNFKKENEYQRYKTDHSMPKKIVSYRRISLTIASN